ncbi:GTP-binding nuclear protein GSP1/CNR1-like [Penaeus japonicus]|uniref:GTP-binding nuclear protein GSP1/CNR1-like n=1 Tax=Penaeus japonicus TaxID=27405 RepID=UPI001C70E116|nr:GTP-binding nuclear protein GSP1/CNR1-like [Penaeus japonicus]
MDNEERSSNLTKDKDDVSTIELPDSTSTSKPGRYKIVLVGDGGTGKSSYVARLNCEGFLKEYVATLGVEKSEILVDTSHGESTIVLWDTAGQEKLGPLRDGYYSGADAAIIFFDVTSRVTYKNVPNWHKDINRVQPDIPVVLCANKIDVKERKVKSKSITYPTKHKIGFYEISVKERTFLKKPLEYLLQQLTKEPELFVKESLDAKIFGDMNCIQLGNV